MTTFNRSEHKTTWIRVGDISVIWANAQRPFNERAAKKIADELDPDVFGIITVCLPNGRDEYHCIDGQTRVGAIKMLWGADQKVPCNIVRASSPAEAAEDFLKTNDNRTKPTAIDRFEVGVCAGRASEVAVNKILKDLGYRITRSHAATNGNIRAVTACTQVYNRRGGEFLKNVLMVIQATFGRAPEAVDGSIIRGYAVLLFKCGDTVNTGRLVERVRRNFAPGALIGAAKSYQQGGMRKSMAEAIAMVLVETYNRGRKKARLDLAA